MKRIIILLLNFFILFVMCCKTPDLNFGNNAFYTQANTLFKQATAQQQAQNFSSAISLYKTLLDLTPPSPETEAKVTPLFKEALLQMMYCYFFSGQRGSAASYYAAFYADTTRWMVRHNPRNIEICLGYSLYEVARLNESVAMIEKALARSEAGIPADELYTDYGIAGAVYNQTGNIHKAIECTEKCAAILRTVEDKTDLINALGNLIYQYQQIGDFNKSIAAYEELIGLKEVKENPYHRCVAEVNIISLFDEWGLEEEVEKHLDAARHAALICGIPEALLRVKSLETAFSFEGNDIETITLAVDSLGTLLPKEEEGSFYRIYYEDFRLLLSLLHTTTSRQEATQQAMQRLKELQATPLDRPHYGTCYNLGKIFARKGYISEAIAAYETCIPYIRENHLLNPQRKVYQALARLYIQQKKYNTASHYYELYDTANSAFTERRNAGLMSQFRVKYETREKEQANELLRTEVRLQHRNLQYYITVGIAIALLFVSIIIWGFMRQRAMRVQHTMDARQHEIDQLHQQEAERIIENQEEKLRQMLYERLELNRKNEKLLASLEHNRTEEKLRKLMESLSPHLLTLEEELHFRRQFMMIHPTFLNNLRQCFPTTSRSEELLTMLIRLNLTNEEITLALGINRGSVNTARSRLRKKFALSTPESLEDFIRSL